MRNTLLLQLPGVRKICLYYIAAPVLLLCLFLGTACPAHAEEIADSSSSTSDSTDTDDDLTLGGDITDAYDKYAGGVDSGLDDVKDQYDGLVNDSTLGFVQAVTSWIPTEFWVIVGLSIGSLVVLGIVSWLKGWAYGTVCRCMYRCAGSVPAQVHAVRLYHQLLGCPDLVAGSRYRNIVYKGVVDR